MFYVGADWPNSRNWQRKRTLSSGRIATDRLPELHAVGAIGHGQPAVDDMYSVLGRAGERDGAGRRSCYVLALEHGHQFRERARIEIRVAQPAGQHERYV